MPSDASDQDPRQKDPGTWSKNASYAQLGFVFPAATFVGWLIGTGLDHLLHTTWIYIPGLLLGVVAGFVELIREVSKKS